MGYGGETTISRLVVFIEHSNWCVRGACGKVGWVGENTREASSRCLEREYSKFLRRALLDAACGRVSHTNKACTPSPTPTTVDCAGGSVSETYLRRAFVSDSRVSQQNDAKCASLPPGTGRRP